MRFGRLGVALSAVVGAMAAFGLLGCSAAPTQVDQLSAASAQEAEPRAEPVNCRTEISTADLGAADDWSEAPAAQFTLQSLARGIEAQFGADGDQALKSGLIGYLIDYHRRGVVVVVDPSLVSLEATQQRVSGVLNEAAGRSATIALAVQVKPSCRSANELSGVVAAVRQREWADQVGVTTYGVSIDPADSTVHIELGASSAKAADLVRQRFGSAVKVTVSTGDFQRAGG